MANYKINIKETEVEVRFSFRADMLFEDCTGHSFAGTSETDWITYYFCTVIARMGDDFISFHDFIDWLDENPSSLFTFVNWYKEHLENVQMFKERSEKKVKESG